MTASANLRRVAMSASIRNLVGLVLLAAITAGPAAADDYVSPFTPTTLNYFEVQEVEVQGDRAYAFHVTGMSVIDISDPMNPVTLSTYPPPPGNIDRFFRGSVSGNLVFGGGRWEQLKIIDVSDPAAPVLETIYGFPGSSYEGSAMVGGLLYAARHAHGIEVLDVSDPGDPQSLATILTLTNSWDLAVQGDHVYVADGTGGLAVLDASVPASPVHLYSVPSAGSAVDIAITGDLAILASGSAGLEIFDISDPLAVSLLGVYNSTALASIVDVAGDRAYLADWDDIEVVDISVPASPSLLGWEDTHSRSMGIEEDNGLILVADWARLRFYGFGPSTDGDIHLPFDGISFGAVPVGETADTTFAVENSGGGTLNVSNIESFNPNFVIQPPLAFAVPSGGRHDVTISFTPVAPGFDGTFVRITSDDPDEDQAVFPLQADDSPTFLDIGEDAPDFTLIDMDGVSHTLSDYEGRVVVLAFFANW